jgi:hypothetical protein
MSFADENALIAFFQNRSAPPAIDPAVINPPTTPPAAAESTKPRGRHKKAEQPQPTVGTNGGSTSPVNSDAGSLAPAGGAPQGDGATGTPVGTAPAGVVPTVEDAKKAGLAVTEKFGPTEGMTKVREICARHGVKLIRDLKPEQVVGFIKDCAEAVA